MNATTDALQETLAGEHAAVWVLGVLGGQVSEASQAGLAADIKRSYRAHRARRDQLTARLVELDEDPAASEPGYELPALETAEALRTEARRIETRCSTLYADQVAHSTDKDRDWAISALNDAAVRALGFGGQATPWPGAADLNRT